MSMYQSTQNLHLLFYDCNSLRAEQTCTLCNSWRDNKFGQRKFGEWCKTCPKQCQNLLNAIFDCVFKRETRRKGGQRKRNIEVKKCRKNFWSQTFTSMRENFWEKLYRNVFWKWANSRVDVPWESNGPYLIRSQCERNVLWLKEIQLAQKCEKW